MRCNSIRHDAIRFATTAGRTGTIASFFFWGGGWIASILARLGETRLVCLLGKNNNSLHHSTDIRSLVLFRFVLFRFVCFVSFRFVSCNWRILPLHRHNQRNTTPLNEKERHFVSLWDCVSTRRQQRKKRNLHPCARAQTKFEPVGGRKSGQSNHLPHNAPTIWRSSDVPLMLV